MTDDSSEHGSVQPNSSASRQRLRLWLARLLKLMGWVMLLGLLYWCVSGLGFDQQTKVEHYQIDVSDISAGQFRPFSVGKQPLIVLHRSESQLASLSDEVLNDASSWQNNDPSRVHSIHRGVEAEWLVVEALGTELNCPVEVEPAGGVFQGRPWSGGFADLCRGQRYDWAGRVYAGQGAKRNLRVMDYQLTGGSRLSIVLR